MSLATVAGLLIGVATLKLQGVLSGAWSQLSNSGAVWVVSSFVAGALLADRGRGVVIAAGTMTEVGEVLGYYGGAQFLLRDTPDLLPTLVSLLAWGVPALIAGPIFGLAGSWWRQERRLWQAIGVGLLGAVFIAEAIRMWQVLHYIPEAVLLAVIGVLLPVALGRSLRGRLDGLLALVPTVAVGVLAYVVIDSFVGFAFGLG